MNILSLECNYSILFDIWYNWYLMYLIFIDSDYNSIPSIQSSSSILIPSHTGHNPNGNPLMSRTTKRFCKATPQTPNLKRAMRVLGTTIEVDHPVDWCLMCWTMLDPSHRHIVRIFRWFKAMVFRCFLLFSSDLRISDYKSNLFRDVTKNHPKSQASRPREHGAIQLFRSPDLFPFPTHQFH